MKMDQVCWYAHNETEAVIIKQALGLIDAEWVVDQMTGISTVQKGLLGPCVQVETEATLRFCYALGNEIEILTFHTPDNYIAHSLAGPSPFAFGSSAPGPAHVGFHLDDDEPWPDISGGATLVQITKTETHTNPFLVESGRRYEYRIWEMFTGGHLKYIRRIRGENE